MSGPLGGLALLGLAALLAFAWNRGLLNGPIAAAVGLFTAPPAVRTPVFGGTSGGGGGSRPAVV